jgi:hypothetical protein
MVWPDTYVQQVGPVRSSDAATHGRLRPGARTADFVDIQARNFSPSRLAGGDQGLPLIGAANHPGDGPASPS